MLPAARPSRPSLKGTGANARAAVALSMLWAAAAHAQPSVPYEEVDPGRADASALSDSLRLVPIDLRTPTAFDRVFRLPTVVGGEMFARIDGGLTAVFPRSEYGFGQALIPAGTTWYIGALPSSVFGESGGASRVHRVGSGVASGVAGGGTASGRLDLRLDQRAGDGPTMVPVWRPEPVRNPLMPWAGELERGARVSDLLRRAAREHP